MNSWARAARAAATISALRGVGAAVGDVFGDRAVEQERFLEHDADVAAIFFDGERADIVAIDEDRAGGDVVEAANQIHERALASAAGADEADHLAGLDREADIANDGACAVFERDVAEFDFAAQTARVNCSHRFGDVRAAIKDFENAMGRRGGPLRGGQEFAHRFEPQVQPSHALREHDERADFEFGSVDDEPGAVAPNH